MATTTSSPEVTQNFKIDINKVYSDFISEIDASRSLVNLSSFQSIKEITTSNVNSLNKFLKIEDTPQESRVHCFYRLIGFPVIDTDKNYYNPGFDNVSGRDRLITLNDKIKIANNPLPNFKQASLFREQHINVIKKIWAPRPATISAVALALSSGAHTRQFNVPVSNPNPFEFSHKDQSFVPEFKSIIGSNNTVLLSDYVDEFGNKPTPGSLISPRPHIIKPFIVDARIDFSCNPSSRKVAVPFVDNKQNLLISENTFVKRPIIEKVIRDRFTVQNQKNNSVAEARIQELIKNFPSVKDEDIIQKATSDKYSLDQKAQFQKYLYLIAAMCKELVGAQLKIKTVQSRYYWLPLPSTDGPEGGCEIKDIIVSDKLPDGDNNTGFITESDRALIRLSLRKSSNEFNAQTAPVSGVPDVGDFAFGAIQSFDPDTSQAFGDQTTDQLAYLSRKRNHDLKIANEALRTVEIIMGEFSGLGLCDILAVMGALYIMPKEKLLGFLDRDAYKRMLFSLNLELADLTSEISNPGIEEAQNSFIGIVTDLYNLMDSIYKDLDKSNGLST